jgi:hypothetical protein
MKAVTLTRRLFFRSLGLVLPAPLPARTWKAGPIHFEVIRNGKSSRRYLHIHGNEETARMVLREHMKHHKGVAFLVRNHQRHFPLLGGQFDPNRIFSAAGAEKNLKMLNSSWTPPQLERALRELARHRDKLIRNLTPPAGGLLIALHNNGRGYSVHSEIPISDEVALNDRDHPHEFFLATQPSDFAILAKSPYNTVLQNRSPDKDDGSFSRVAAARGIRYVNLEVSLGKFDRQKEMLDWLERNLP